MNCKSKISDLSERFSPLLTLLEVPLPEIRLMSALDDGSLANDDLRQVLSAAELAEADRRSDAAEHRHILFRRSFQRLFVGRAIGWQQSLAALALHHATDRPPVCGDAPGLSLSFSSSGAAYVAAAAPSARLGVDIEERRDIANVEALARRFFTPDEAELVSGTPAPLRSGLFQTLWCAKEAGLKAMGRGIVSGLNTFALQPDGDGWKIIDSGTGDSEFWQLWFCTTLPRHIVAVMHRPAINSRAR